MDFRWVCCLNPLELEAVLLLAYGLPASLFVGVPAALFEAVWLQGYPSSAARREAFLSYMHLEIVTILVGDPPVEVDVVRPLDLAEWTEICLYVDTTIPLCPLGCEYQSFP